LDDNAVVIANVRWRDLEMVYGGDDVEFQFAARRCLKDARIDLNLLGTGTVECTQSGKDAGFLASTTGPIE